MIAQAAGKSVLPDRCEGDGICVAVFFFQAEDGIRDYKVTGVQTCALPISAAWKTRFGADSSVLGRSVTLDGRPHRVIGVLSDAFRDPFSPVEVFLPIASAPSQSWFTRGSPSFWAFGRLKTGVTLEQAQGDLSRVARDLAQEYPSPNANTRASG